jgi:hypothetical protein
MRVEVVPTINFVLNWITGYEEKHGLDNVAGALLGVLAARMLRPEMPAPPAPPSESPPG